MTAPAYQSPEWYAERSSYIGASEMAAVVGLSKWDDALTVWERKVAGAPEKESSFRMNLGSLAEPIIGKLASERLGVRLRKVTGPVRHPDHPFLASNPDFRIVGARGLVQAKFSLNGEAFGDDDGSGSGESIPLHYRVQGWGELLTTGLDFVYFAVLHPYDGLSTHLIDRRSPGVEDSIEDLRLDLVEYWTQYVETRTMPPPGALSGEALKRRFPTRAGKIGKVASAEQVAAIESVAELKASIAELEATLEEQKNIVKAFIGDAAWIEGGGYRASWGETHRKTVAWKEVASVYRGMLELVSVEYPGLLSDIAHVPGLFERGASEDLDTIEGLYTTESTDRGPFTVAKLK